MLGVKCLMKEVISVSARDGAKVSATWFIADNPHEKVVLINSATGVKQTYYADFAEYLVTQGFNVYTFDYRGIGASRPKDIRYLFNDMKDWSKDVDAMIGHITRIHAQARLVVIGHSVGGQLIGMSRLSKSADAFVMIGAQTPYWRNFEGFWLRAKLLLFWYVMIPWLTKITGYFPASKLGLFEDLPEDVALQWARWAKTPHYVFDEYPELRSSFESLDQQTLTISFSDDTIAPYKAVKDLQGFYPRLKKEHWHLRPEDLLQKKVGHFGFFRKKMAPTLWQDTTTWIQNILSVKKNKAA